MNNSSKIYVAGHNGMVGSAIIRKLNEYGFTNLLFRSRSDLDLINQNEVMKFFLEENPDFVFIAAAKVGGIQANNTLRGEYLYENLLIQSNIIHSAHINSVEKVLFLGSACIYPRSATQPIKEEYLLSNYLEPTNEPYAIAKIAGIKLCENYYHQYGNNFISIMPNNLYGPYDNFNLETSHVLPALIRKFHEAKINGGKYVEVWGSGLPLREFMHVDDMASACIFLMKNISAREIYDSGISHINASSGDEVSIKELALLIKEIVDYNGEIKFNSEFPDGMPRKLLDISRISKLGWKSNIKLKDGIKSVYRWYVNNN